MNTSGTDTLDFGMVKLPIKLGKADVDEGVDLSSRCACGAGVEPARIATDDDGELVVDADGGAVICEARCGEVYSWWNSVPGKAYEAGDDEITLDPDELAEARDEVPVETGRVEKVSPVKEVLLQYAVTGNYYVVPEDEDFGDQYAVIEAALDAQNRAILTYLGIGKVRRYAIIAEGGTLLALQLADKKPLDEPTDFEVPDGMMGQAKNLLDSSFDPDPALDDVQDQGVKELIRSKLAPEPEPDPDPAPEPEADAETETEADEEAETEAEATTDGGEAGLARFQ